MGKYEPLRDHLAALADRTTVRMTFNEIAGLVGSLPAAAWQHPSWWGNETGADHAQSHAWRDAGWRITILEQREEWVEFARADA